MIWLRVFLPFAAGYYISYLFRTVNAVISPELTVELGLSPSDLGLLTSAYFLTFAVVQLPVGLALDRYGAGRTNSALLVFTAIGSGCFALATSTWGLILARALIGFGVAAALMGAFKAFVDHFPRESLPRINGFQMAAGGLGALTATVPVDLASDLIGWRGVFWGLSLLTLIIAAILWLAVPVKRREPESLSRQLAGLAQVYRSPVFWRLAPLTMASQGGFVAVVGLWSGPWLRDVGGLGQDQIAGHLLVIALAMVAGFISMGTLAERLGRIGLKPVGAVLAGVVLFVIVQLPLALLMTDNLLLTWIGFGFFGTTGIVSYAVLSQQFPAELAGRLNTALNMQVFLTSFALQWGIGLVIGLFEAPAGGGYAPEGYQAALFSVIGLQVAGLCWYGLFRKGRRQAE
ncbi:MAG: MFS transporter [Magnetovibrionaceae bacterium]